VGRSHDLSEGPAAAACSCAARSGRPAGPQPCPATSRCLADRISQLSPEKKDHLAELLRSDRILVTAIVRHSHFKQIIDLCLKMLAIVSNTRLAWVLREELAYRKRKRDRKPDPEQLKRNEVIRAEQEAGKTLGQLAKKYHLTRQRIQQIVREKVSSN
jgi:hypothetical protein